MPQLMNDILCQTLTINMVAAQDDKIPLTWQHVPNSRFPNGI